MKKYYQLGIEITDEKLHFTVARKQLKNWSVLQTDSMDGQPHQIESSLQAIRALIPSSVRNVVIGLPYHQVMIKEINVDASLSPAEIYQFLQQQSPTLFGETLSFWYLDFEKITEYSSQQTTIRIAAASKNIVNEWRYLCRKNGFKLVAVEIDVLALLRLGSWIKEHHDQKAFGLLWIKQSEILLIIVEKSQLKYIKRSTRTDNFSVTEQLATMIRLFKGLYPQYELEEAFLLGDSNQITMGTLISKNPQINTDLIINSEQLCSLSLSVADYD